MFRNITLRVAHSSSCGPDDGHELTETFCPIEYIQDPCNRDLAFVVSDGILNKLSYFVSSSPSSFYILFFFPILFRHFFVTEYGRFRRKVPT